MANELLPPRPSPGTQDMTTETPSGSHFVVATMADVKEAKLKAEAVASVKVEEQRKLILSSDVKWFVGTMSAVAVGAACLVLWFQGIAKAEAKEKAQTVQADLDQHKKDEDKRLEKIEQSMTELKQETHESLRDVNKKQDALLQHFVIYNPAPTPPEKKDGGR